MGVQMVSLPIWVDERRHIFGVVALALAGLLRLDRYGREQSGGDERLAKIVGHAAVVEVAALEARKHADMFGIEGLLAGRLDIAEPAARADIDGQRIDPVPCIAVEQYVALPDLGERIAFLRPLHRDRPPGPLDTLRDQRRAPPHPPGRA